MDEVGETKGMRRGAIGTRYDNVGNKERRRKKLSQIRSADPFLLPRFPLKLAYFTSGRNQLHRLGTHKEVNRKKYG